MTRLLHGSLLTVLFLCVLTSAQAGYISTPPTPFPFQPTGLQVASTPTVTVTVCAASCNFTTVSAALVAAQQIVLNPLTNYIIDVQDGTIAEPGTLLFQGAYNRNIRVQGHNTYAVSVTSIQSSSGATGAWSIVLNVNTVTNVAVNDYIIITGGAGGTNPTYLNGVFKITNVDVVNTRITIASTHHAAAAPSGAVTANGTVIKSILTFSGNDGADCWNGQSTCNWRNIVLVGDGTHDGISAQDIGRVFSDGKVGIVGFNRDTYLLYNSQWNSTDTVAFSGATSHGVDCEENSNIDWPLLASEGNGGAGVLANIGCNIHVSGGGASGNASSNFNDSDFSSLSISSTYSTGAGVWGVAASTMSWANVTSMTFANNSTGDTQIPITTDGGGNTTFAGGVNVPGGSPSAASVRLGGVAGLGLYEINSSTVGISCGGSNCGFWSSGSSFGATSVNVGTASTTTGSFGLFNSGSANKLILQSASIATANRTLTFPDPGGADTIPYLALGQTFSGADVFSNASFKLTGITTGTNADVVCKAADGTLLIQAAASCTISDPDRKTDKHVFTASVLSGLMKLQTWTYRVKGWQTDKDPNAGDIELGLMAPDIVKNVSLCAMYYDDGHGHLLKKPRGYRQECMIAVLVKGMQEQQSEIVALKLDLKRHGL